MSAASIALLGAIAGLTIFLGLPVGRLRRPAPRVQAFLNALALGILVFLLWDVLSQAIDPIETALEAATSAGGGGSWARFAGLAVLAVAGITVGLMSLTYYESWMAGRARNTRIGPGSATAAALRPSAIAFATPAARLSLLIAVGIGLHNFSEGLAIGQSAASGEIGLALLLIIGFGLHNATEGFGIVAPLTGEDAPPSWAMLGVLGLIGGGPTFLGTLVGQSVVNDYLGVVFLSLAAGSILYVVIQLLKVGFKLGYTQLLMWGLLLGLFAGIATDLVLVAAGA